MAGALGCWDKCLAPRATAPTAAWVPAGARNGARRPRPAAPPPAPTTDQVLLWRLGLAAPWAWTVGTADPRPQPLPPGLPYHLLQELVATHTHTHSVPHKGALVPAQVPSAALLSACPVLPRLFQYILGAAGDKALTCYPRGQAFASPTWRGGQSCPTTRHVHTNVCKTGRRLPVRVAQCRVNTTSLPSARPQFPTTGEGGGLSASRRCGSRLTSWKLPTWSLCHRRGPTWPRRGPQH